MDELITTYNLPFFEWREKHVMTFTMVDKLYGLKRGRAVSIFHAHKSEFLEGHDVYLLRGVEPYDELPVGITPYGTNRLWLITESGYQILSRIIRNSPSRKKIKPL